MSQTRETSILDRMLEPVSRCLDVESARRLIELRIDPEVQARVDQLAALANEGAMSVEERDEYETYINADDLISILIIKAKQILKAHDLS